MTTAQMVEDILRPLAEATVWPSCTCKGGEDGWRTGPCILHSGSPREAPDPRFDALRYSWFSDPDYGYLGVGSRMNVWPPGHEEGDEEVKRIDASLGAIRRAMVACGWNMLLLTTYGEKVFAEVLHSQQSKAAGVGQGATDEEAAGRALVAAWKGGNV